MAENFREIHIFFLHFVREFDSVSHEAVIFVLEEAGLPLGNIEYITKLTIVVQQFWGCRALARNVSTLKEECGKSILYSVRYFALLLTAY